MKQKLSSPFSNVLPSIEFVLTVSSKLPDNADGIHEVHDARLGEGFFGLGQKYTLHKKKNNQHILCMPLGKCRDLKNLAWSRQ